MGDHIRTKISAVIAECYFLDEDAGKQVAEPIEDDHTRTRHFDDAEKCGAMNLKIQHCLPTTEVPGWKTNDINFTMECLNNFEVIAEGYHTWEDPGYHILGTCADSTMSAKTNGQKPQYERALPTIIREA